MNPPPQRRRGILGVISRAELKSCPGKAKEWSLAKYHPPSGVPPKALQDFELELGGQARRGRQSGGGRVPRGERVKVPVGWEQ